MKENVIKELQINKQNNDKKWSKCDSNDIIVVNFISNEVHYGIKCLPTDAFVRWRKNCIKDMIIQEKLIICLLPIQNLFRIQKLCENNIHDSDIIQLFKNDTSIK